MLRQNKNSDHSDEPDASLTKPRGVHAFIHHSDKVVFCAHTEPVMSRVISYVEAAYELDSSP